MKNVALIGVGMVGSVYAEAIHDLKERLNLRGVLGSQPQSGKKFLKQHRDKFAGKPKVFTSVDEIANDTKTDFVILATPPNQRFEPIELLIKGRKPVLMEKPVERRHVNAAEICLWFESAGLPAGVVFQHRVRPSAVQLRERLAKDDFGPLNLVEIRVPWWRDQSYYDEPGRGTYMRDGGGVLISQAIHTLDLALTFAGPVHSVVAQFASTRFHKMGSEDTVTAGLVFRNGAIGSLFATTAAFPGRTEEILLHYEKASILLQSGLLKIHHQNGREEEIGTSSATGAGADPMAFTSDWHRDVIANFLDVLDGTAEPVASIREALRVHAVMNALQESAYWDTRVDVKGVLTSEE